jgi:hypothetical protein
MYVCRGSGLHVPSAHVCTLRFILYSLVASRTPDIPLYLIRMQRTSDARLSPAKRARVSHSPASASSTAVERSSLSAPTSTTPTDSFSKSHITIKNERETSPDAGYLLTLLATTGSKHYPIPPGCKRSTEGYRQNRARFQERCQKELLQGATLGLKLTHSFWRCVGNLVLPCR